MRQLKFSKYHGTGNDFILIDNREMDITLSGGQIAFLCDRHFGIGADGLMFLQPSDKGDFEMRYYNSDGGEGTMCGNGGRCMTAFARSLGLIDRQARFLAIDGEHESTVLSGSGNEIFVSLKMQDIDGAEVKDGNYIINSGSPHFVKFVANIDEIDPYAEGKKIRWGKEFQPDGINVNFVEIKNDHIIVRTFERGVENITLSCGTGSIAASVATSLTTGSATGKVEIKTLGGDLTVRFTRNGDIFTDIFLEGPAVKVFEGVINL